MRKKLKTGISLIRYLEEQLNKRLPSDWSFRLDEQPARGITRADAIFTLQSPDGRFGILALEVKTTVEPRMITNIKRQAERAEFENVLIAAPFLSPRTRDLLSNENLSYADLTGNLRLSISEPAVFIETQGAMKNPGREKQPLMSLKGPAVARVIRALCDFRPPYSIGELADRSGASPASTSRVVALLEKEALLTRQGRSIIEVNWDELLQRWTQDYSLLNSNRVLSALEPRGLSFLREKLSTTRSSYAVTGSLAITNAASVAPPRLATIYSPDPARLSDLLGLRPADAGANVFLLEPFDPVIFERTSSRDGLKCVAFSQVAADLLTSPGRGPAEGEELLRWMKENEDEWRA
jgi:hypothetical protein